MLKKEIRILGLSSRPIRRSATLLVGVVFRGNLWLDAVFSCILDTKRRDFLARLDRAIRSSNQYPQLHAIVLHEHQFGPGRMIWRLSHRIGLPILAISRKRSRSTASCQVLAGRRSITLRPVGTDCDHARAIFAVTTTRDHSFPEALRIADMIVKSSAPRR